MEEIGSRSVGIDLAKRSYVARAVGDHSKTTVWDGTTDQKGVERLCSKLKASDRVGIEACALSFYLAKVIESRVGCRVLVLNPGDLALIYKSVKKTDLEDAGKLAWLIHRMPDEELPVVTPPTEQEEHRRAMVSELSAKKRARTVLINRLHSLFVRQGIVVVGKAELSTDKTRTQHVAALTDYTLTEAGRIQEELTLVERHIREITDEVKQELRNDPRAPILMSIPGVGPTTAIAFLAHIGDTSRFSRARQVSHFVGMTPRVGSSGETTRLGNITKRGCRAIRSVIVQSAWACVHSKTNHGLKRKFAELEQRRGKGRAIVAIARRMLELMWVLVRNNTLYREVDQNRLTLKLAKLRVA